MTITTSLISLGTWLATKISDKGFDSLYGSVVKDATINDKFYSAVTNTSKILQKKYPNVLDGNIEYFFKSEKVFNELFKLLFKSSKLNERVIEKQFDIDTLPIQFIKQFVEQLRFELLKDPLFDKILSDNQLYILFQGVDKNIQLIAENTFISSKDIKELKDIISKKLSEKFDYQSFKELYTQNAINSLSQINFLGLGIDSHKKINRKNLQDIFIKPLFQPLNKISHQNKMSDELDDPDEENIIDYKGLLSFHDKVVILGNPGAGKSLLIKSLMCDILSNKEGVFNDNSVCECIPFRIELRKYIVFKKETKGTILKYISSSLESEYQINNISENILNEIFNHYQSIVFFDGLDEIFNISDKIDTKTDIENFQNKFPKLKSVTTSRIIGYEETSLNDNFQELYLRKFNDDQIEEYLRKWYEKEEDNEEIRDREINGFLNKMHEIDKELIANPLLLSLIVIIYRNALKLPESKLEIYQSCTKTLVDKWEAIKDLKFDLDPIMFKNKDKLFADLAYWQYEKLSGESPEITYEKAKQTVSNSLLRLDIADHFNSDTLAEEFMNYAAKRSIYFEDNFTHKTFLEYYTAYWIYSNVEREHNVKLRNSIITKYIGNPYWNTVLELLFNLIDKDLGTNTVIDTIIDEQIKKSTASLPFLLSVCLKLKNISNSRLNKIVERSILTELTKYGKADKDTKVFSALELFCIQSDKAREIVIKQINILEDQYENQPVLQLKLYTLYIELNLSYRLNRADTYEVKNLDVFNKIVNQNDYLYIINTYAFNYDKSFLSRFKNYITIFQVSNVFKNYQAKYEVFSLGPFINSMFYKLSLDYDYEEVIKYLVDCNTIGLKYEYMINHLATESRLYHATQKQQTVLVESLRVCTELPVQKLLLLLLFKYVNNSFLQRNRKALFTNHQFEKLVTAEFLKTTFKEKIKIILALTSLDDNTFNVKAS